MNLKMEEGRRRWNINACVIPKVAEGCRKIARSEWVELLRRAFHEIGITAEFATMPRRAHHLESLV